MNLNRLSLTPPQHSISFLKYLEDTSRRRSWPHQIVAKRRAESDDELLTIQPFTDAGSSPSIMN